MLICIPATPWSPFHKLRVGWMKRVTFVGYFSLDGDHEEEVVLVEFVRFGMAIMAEGKHAAKHEVEGSSSKRRERRSVSGSKLTS